MKQIFVGKTTNVVEKTLILGLPKLLFADEFFIFFKSPGFGTGVKNIFSSLAFFPLFQTYHILSHVHTNMSTLLWNSKNKNYNAHSICFK